ncbi:plasmid replication initiator protein [Streptomyces sp. DW4-2]|uniref:Plasmid replication initiator protein n=1 Tax=Streptomyces spirodelae TaxID=2812904 RepID=A0ABS3WVW5_9ACTN|nr:replication initiator [Streptomyces spirodelae]MBO8187279.1 plasmid replication initiator protein [Streptomyces spirodelae]
MRQLSEVDRDVIRLAQDPQFPRWLEQVTATGGCAHPVHLSGSTSAYDAATGELLHHYDTSAEPGERLSVRCRNRRASVCAPCSRLHAGDTFHLVRAGLNGGKGVPDAVREHPRLFITLTAPSFGPVHRATDGERCRPRRTSHTCEHGRSKSCGAVHRSGDPLIGHPLCTGCYDYPAHVLWHAHAGRLWKAFTDNLYNHLATRTGHTRAGLRRAVRVSYAKVAEYQQRAAVHVHAVVRLDGPDGPNTVPPLWLDAHTLASAVHTAASAVRLRTPYTPALGEYNLRWGNQLDVRTLRAFNDPSALSDNAVAAYVAKYVTKGAAETSAGLDHRVNGTEEITSALVSRHVRLLMATCWRLGVLPELEPLRLRSWAHTIGYRGHILTKSRSYSTTYALLREERAQHEREPDAPGDTDVITERHWRYVGSGHTPGAALIAAGVASDLARNREEACEVSTSAGGGRR